MYAGDGKRIGHGGPPGVSGPNLTPLSKDANRFVMAKRLKDVGSGSGIYGSKDYINTVHEKGSIMSIDKKQNIEQQKQLRNKARIASSAITGKGSVSDETMITLIKSIVGILTTMANNSNKINTIVELLQNYFDAKNNATNKTKQQTTKSKSSSTVPVPKSTELDVATQELVNYLNSLAV